jgi:DNA-binding beta-propeller fold protein YncE
MAFARVGVRGVLVLIGLLTLGLGCGGRKEQAPRFAAQWTEYAGAGAIDHPEGLAVDPQGMLLVADTWNHRILRVDPTSAATPAPGGRPPTPGQNNGVLPVRAPRAITCFGERGSKPGQFQCPRSVTTDKRGDIYVVDNWNHRVEKFTREGRFLLKFGEKGGPFGYDEAPGKFVYPYGIAVDSKGFIYVSDFNNNRVHKFDPRGKFVMMWGTEGRQDGQFSHPAGLAVDSQDRLYVADLGNDRIQAFRSSGDKMAFDGKWGEAGHEPGQFDRPYSVSVDAKANVYVVDFGNHRVQKFDPSGRVLFATGEWGAGQGELDCPISAAVGPDGALYISDLGNNRIQKWTPAS